MATPIQLPVIDISDPLNAAVGKDMLDAAIKYGFFYVHGKGSDFSAAEVDSTFELSKKFFALPKEEKEKCTIRTDNRGWSGMHSEILDPEHQRTGDFKEALNFGEFKDGKLQQPIPPALEPHEADIKHFTELCNKTCARVMRLLALGLEINSEFFVTRHDASQGETGCVLRFLYYPSINSPASSSYQHDIDVRAGAHSDYGTITLLFQRPGQPGLEILTSGDTWAPVPVWPEGATSAKDDFPPILINIGDMLSFWTNGLLKSTIHRVVFPMAERNPSSSSAKPQDRYSVVFFCHPVNECNLVPPVPSPLVTAAVAATATGGTESGNKVGFGGGAGSLRERSSMTAKEYLDMRLSATYGQREEA
ncbi:hypothetical protein UA08_03493 [Talaromyces atroroseus]|uniref:Fe2OG dioxygenase domain-containing protein n=1 Tax=Talaromyces atroroseus TaxID=1441469 RepID=A0A225B0H7_TALAT|nr:hypothetical protein UA08_03493 [Talaromyces atroroseus]OKL61469.1 hypothetical protein UA08_03493 [Talaromyces atroroseus]